MDAGQVTRTEVPEAFDEVADRYDLMVGMSPGYHAQLRASADALLDAIPDAATPSTPGVASASTASADALLRLLDLGCGSGASTRAIVESVRRHTAPGARTTARPASVLAVDGSAGMLDAARSKAWPSWVAFAQGRAEDLADQPELADARVAGGLDGVLAAYLVRNVPDRDAVIAAIRDELRPGGVVALHDYSVRGRPVSTALWTAMCWGIIIPLGWVTSRRTRLYRYLWRSVLDMDSTAQLEDRLRRAGFVDVTTLHASGWQRGIVHTVLGRRPVDA
ncbi:ubiquinone/menaquinone biosynthesis C-methylase UbiE [Humibacillus xanthopallidus]|uniref:Ubiquinone/menaquinone biosynthesis C-methylase UbiE n=1 Tax=Humibacillus xanthopallidus TaxID=412689 RepID=A0A543PR89_9MICO|nr:class I SAM-dependent methyltransferase [Humibacillus xanthopallidus]TQN46593.1 ubiquinone/menaquinone biosynthesis C-methylase UbiE [Humibacillus xanthopallidus]